MISKIQSITQSDIRVDIDAAADSIEVDVPQTALTKESQVREQCVSMLSRLPTPYNKYTVAERLQSMGCLKPIIIFLRQEVQRMTKLLEVSQVVLKNLIDAIDGKIVMNKDLRSAMDAIFNAKVPAIWLRVSSNRRLLTHTSQSS